MTACAIGAVTAALPESASTQASSRRARLAVVVVGSFGSRPWIAANTRAQSSALRASGPTLSMLQHRVMQPCRLTRPKVGLSPVAPQRVHGDTMLPHVSLPRVKPTRPAAVALAEPADEPLEPRVGFQGFLVRLSANQRSP